LEVRWKAVSLPYHTAIVENKRLGHALTLVKAQQDLKYAPKVMTNSEKIGYRKRPRKVYGSDEVTNLLPARDAVEMTV
jgi:hypothetical protein